MACQPALQPTKNRVPTMSGGRGNFSGRGRGGGGFNRGGRGGFGGRGGRGGFQAPVGPPQEIVEVGEYLHECENELVCKFDRIDPTKVPYFNGRVFLSNKTEVGKIDEILGPLNQMYVSVKAAEGVKPGSLPTGTKMYIDAQQVLPLQRFLPTPPSPIAVKKKSKSTDGGRSFTGGRSTSRGGGQFRGASGRNNNFRGRGGGGRRF